MHTLYIFVVSAPPLLKKLSYQILNDIEYYIDFKLFSSMYAYIKFLAKCES